MEAIRTTMNSARLAPIIDLPDTLRNREVEVIVLPKAEKPKKRPPVSERKSMMGCLSEYANPALRELDEGAWEPSDEESSVESIMGILKEYANPTLRELEEGIWERAAVEKHLAKMNDDYP